MSSKRLIYIILFFFFFSSLLFSVDFDVVMVGSSPISLLEALYQHHCGKKVLVLEAGSTLGGAWKSIDVCGVYPVDLGCHTLGKDKKLLEFLEVYLGCHMVSMDNPHAPFDNKNSPNGFYPIGGCYEIMHNILRRIEKTDIVILSDHFLESVFIDPEVAVATIKTKGEQFTTSKIFITPFTEIHVEGGESIPTINPVKFYHLYMLIADPTPPRFSFCSGILTGVSRLMNLTCFAGLEQSGMQLLVFQTYTEHYLTFAQEYFTKLKNKNFLDPSARLLKVEPYIYEQKSCPPTFDSIKNADSIFEKLTTNHIQDMVKYISRWTQVLQPFDQVVP